MEIFKTAENALLGISKLETTASKQALHKKYFMLMAIIQQNNLIYMKTRLILIYMPYMLI